MKHTIEIEGLPEGWEAVAHRIPLRGDSYLEWGQIVDCIDSMPTARLIVKKKQPRRIVLEETFEVRNALFGDYIERLDAPGIGFWSNGVISPNKYKIWRVVENTGVRDGN